MLTELAPAKVNLFLHVVGRRDDGYHELDSLAVFPGAADRLEATLADDLTLQVGGPFGAGLNGESDNLVLRAARALADHAGAGFGARLALEKHLPIASGIGGGSADAAAALRLLARLWGLSVPDQDLLGIALRLGADVPVCLASRAARMTGLGDRLGPAPGLPPFGMMLANPCVGVSTPEVFRARSGPFSPPAHLPQAWFGLDAMVDSLRGLSNDLEAPALQLCPAIADVLAWLRAQPGCLLARMSGSGATCFGLFAPGDAPMVAARAAPSGWWAWGGGFTEGPRTA